MIHFFLLVNKLGQTRLSQYYNNTPLHKRAAFEGEVVRKCLSRPIDQCSFFEFQQNKIVYRRYASLIFIVGMDETENEIEVYEFIHSYVEVLDSNFENVCELDIMFNLEKAHIILDEMITNGHIVETKESQVNKMYRLMVKVD
eukprot:TRINITY_DN18082_c0_g1_i1.p1 TRINITY_DN18082_c0_g1~~TRINITY_DN18082_c0_g1_i1.p1  ORF type:complete len:143 (-),score=8.24 TRINITY_DN18082_c0_g1_i1:30-458(-)